MRGFFEIADDLSQIVQNFEAIQRELREHQQIAVDARKAGTRYWDRTTPRRAAHQTESAIQAARRAIETLRAFRPRVRPGDLAGAAPGEIPDATPESGSNPAEHSADLPTVTPPGSELRH